MTPEEAKAKYEAEWPALNTAKEAATTQAEAKKARQMLSWLSTACDADILGEAADALDHKDKQIMELREALDELATLMDDIIAGNYKPDSFTCQPARKALAATDDLKDCILCDAEPVAQLFCIEERCQEVLLLDEVDKETFASSPELYEPLYKARKQP